MTKQNHCWLEAELDKLIEVGYINIDFGSRQSFGCDFAVYGCVSVFLMQCWSCWNKSWRAVLILDMIFPLISCSSNNDKV